MSSSPLVDITDREIDPREVEKAVWTSADGAMVTFSGVVRDHDGGREVHDIEYSAHPTARDTLARLCDEVAVEIHRHPLLAVGLGQRRAPTAGA